MYTPSPHILENYAHILVDFALNSGRGISAKDVVYIQFDSPALPLALAVYKRVLEKGGYPMIKMAHEGFSKVMYNVATDDQLEFFPKKYMKALVDTIDHRMYLMADTDPLLLKSVDPKKIMKANKSRRLMKRWLFDKEDRGKLTWTIALYGTEGMAKEAELSLTEYWEQIERACFLREAHPIQAWRGVYERMEHYLDTINELPIDKLHVTAQNTDLWITLGEKRKWMGGSGRNIPSFEIFTSPDWRLTAGHIFFDLPLYRYGNIIKDIYIEFKNGRVVASRAAKNEQLLKEMIKQKNADKIGEYSLTDRRFSHITKFMAETLFDENFGGQWGNTHLAVGSSYHDCYKGKAKLLKAADWNKLGYNDSVEHCDIIATTDRTVEATLNNGVKKIIYTGGEFVL